MTAASIAATGTRALPPEGRAALRAGVVGNFIDNIHVFLPVTALAPAMPVQVAAAAAPAPALTTPPPAGPTVQHAALPVVAVGRAAPAMARLAEAARGAVAVARVRPQAVALLDRQLLSDTTFGDLASGARREARR